MRRGVPEHVRSDNDAEFTAEAVRVRLARVGVQTLFIEPGSPWEKGYVETFNGKLRDEQPDREAFDALLEAKVLIERWRVRYNTVRPHRSLGFRSPAPEGITPCTPALGAPLLGTAAMAGSTETLTLPVAGRLVIPSRSTAVRIPRPGGRDAGLASLQPAGDHLADPELPA